MYPCLKLQLAEISRLFCLWMKNQVFQSNELCLNCPSQQTDDVTRGELPRHNKRLKHLNDKSPSIFREFHPDTSAFSRSLHSAVTILSLIISSSLCWGTSAAVWNGQGTFSQRCHHHSCISKASRFPPVRFATITLSWNRPSYIYLSVRLCGDGALWRANAPEQIHKCLPLLMSFWPSKPQLVTG